MARLRIQSNCRGTVTVVQLACGEMMWDHPDPTTRHGFDPGDVGAETWLEEGCKGNHSYQVPEAVAVVGKVQRCCMQVLLEPGTGTGGLQCAKVHKGLLAVLLGSRESEFPLSPPGTCWDRLFHHRTN